MNVVMPVVPAVDAAGDAAKASAITRACRLYMLKLQLERAATDAGGNFEAVVKFAGDTKNTLFCSRASFIMAEAKEYDKKLKTAVANVVRLGGKQYKRLARHKFIIRQVDKTKYTVGKRAIKINDRRLIDACRLLSTPTVVPCEELQAAYCLASNVSASAFRSSS